LQALLADKLVFLPVKTPGAKCYEVTGRLAIGGLLRLPADSRMVASTGLASAAELLAGQVERGRLGSTPAAGLLSMALTQSDLLPMSRGPFGPRRSRPVTMGSVTAPTCVLAVLARLLRPYRQSRRRDTPGIGDDTRRRLVPPQRSPGEQ